jgi:transposase
MSKLNHSGAPATAAYATVHLVFELSKTKWKARCDVAGLGEDKLSTIAGGDLKALAARPPDARAKAERFGRPVRIVSRYEAGFDGHWLHRWLTAQGVINYERDPASSPVNRRARRAKTDRFGGNALNLTS